MVLETYLKLGVTAGFFSNFFFAANMWKMDQKRTQMVVFLTENVVIIILLICSLIKFLLFAVLLRKSYIWEKSGSWDMDRIALSQPDSRIFKSNISLEQNH